MPATMPVDTGPTACEVRLFKGSLHADPAKKSKVNLPDGAIYRGCANPREGAQVITKPDSGGTTACVFYEFTVDAKAPDITFGKRKAAISKALADKSCPAVDFSMQSYPGKDWFFLSDNVPLENAYRAKARVESAGLAFLSEEKKQLKNSKAGLDFGTSPLGVYAISAAPAMACHNQKDFFHERYAACYTAVIYNRTMRGGWSVRIGLRTNGEYKFIASSKENQ